MGGPDSGEGHGRVGFVPYRKTNPGATARFTILHPARPARKDPPMKMRLIAALILAVGAVSLSAQEPNPYAKAKVGDFATFKTSTKLAGIAVDGTLTQQVTAVPTRR